MLVPSGCRCVETDTCVQRSPDNPQDSPICRPVDLQTALHLNQVLMLLSLTEFLLKVSVRAPVLLCALYALTTGLIGFLRPNQGRTLPLSAHTSLYCRARGVV